MLSKTLLKGKMQLNGTPAVVRGVCQATGQSAWSLFNSLTWWRGSRASAECSPSLAGLVDTSLPLPCCFHLWYQWYLTLSVWVPVVLDIVSSGINGAWHCQFRYQWCLTLSVQVSVVLDIVSMGVSGAWLCLFRYQWCLTLSGQVPVVLDIVSLGTSGALHGQFRYQWCLILSIQVPAVLDIVSSGISGAWHC